MFCVPEWGNLGMGKPGNETWEWGDMGMRLVLTSFSDLLCVSCSGVWWEAMKLRQLSDEVLEDLVLLTV